MGCVQQCSVHFHDQAPGIRYRKFGPTTPGDPLTNTWYDLPNAFFDTQMLGSNLVTRVSYLLQDGALGDSTAVDGVIVDPGGPAVPVAPNVPALSPTGLALLLLAMAIAGSRRNSAG